MSKKSPSLSAIRSANAAEARVLQNIHTERKQFVSDLSDTVAMAVVSLDDHKENVKEASITKQIAGDYGFTFDSKSRKFTKVQNGTPISVSFDDMISYKNISMRTDQNLNQIFLKPSILKLHTLSTESILDNINTYLNPKKPKFGRRLFNKRTTKKLAASKKNMSSIMEGDLLDFENSLSNVKEINSSDELLDSVNETYGKTYGNLDEYYSDIKLGNVKADKLASVGKHGDQYITMVNNELAHVNKEELYLKQVLGDKADEYIMENGAGTISSISGLKMYYTSNNNPSTTSMESPSLLDTALAAGGTAVAAVGVGSIIQGGMMAYNAIEGHQADSRRVGQINSELSELANSLKNTQNEKITATDSIISGAGLEVDSLTSSAGDSLNALTKGYESTVKSGKGLKTGDQDTMLVSSKNQVKDQVSSALNKIEESTQLKVQETGGQYDQQVADIERYEEQLRNEKEQLKGKFTYKIADAMPF